MEPFLAALVLYHLHEQVFLLFCDRQLVEDDLLERSYLLVLEI